MEINDAPVVVDFRVHRDAMVWPMVAAGTSNDDIKYARDLAPRVRRGRALSHEHATPCPCWSRTSPASWPGSRACSAGAASTSTRSPSGPTEHAEVSRMTIVVNVEDSPLEQVTKQLNKLVEVIKIVELDGAASVNRELLLVKVARRRRHPRPGPRRRSQLFRAKVVDVAPDAVTIEVDRQRRQARRRSCAVARALRHPRARPVRHGRDRPRLAARSPSARLRPVAVPAAAGGRRLTRRDRPTHPTTNPTRRRAHRG